MRKFERQGVILRLVSEQELSTQTELAAALHAAGFDAVQTTGSRDVAELGLVKVRNEEGRLVYAPPGAADLSRLGELASALRRWALSIVPTGTIVVIIAVAIVGVYLWIADQAFKNLVEKVLI